MPDIPKYPKREWPDGIERVCDGSVIAYGKACGEKLIVKEIPKEVRSIMRDSSEDVIELHHHADPLVEVYVNQYNIIAIDARWSKIETD